MQNAFLRESLFVEHSMRLVEMRVQFCLSKLRSLRFRSGKIDLTSSEIKDDDLRVARIKA